MVVRTVSFFFLKEFYINSFSVGESASNLSIVIILHTPLFFMHSSTCTILETM